MTVSRVRSRRLGGILATALFTIALVPGLATAADTRILGITMTTPTPVSIPATGQGPYATKFEVRIENGGGQNLAHTVLTIQADATDNAQLAYAAKYDPDGGSDASDTFCTPSGDTLTCDYGSLGAGASRTVAVVVSVTSSYLASGSPLFKASVTTNNENGTNTQTFPVDSGSFAVQPTGANTLSTFALDGASQDLSTTGVGGDAGNLSTHVKFNASNKELVQITEGNSTTNALYACPSGLSCQDDYSEVSTTTGSFTNSPFFTWTVTAIVPKTYSLSQGFVAHYPTGATTYDPNDTTGAYWTLMFNDRSALCGKNISTKIASAHHCIASLSLTKFNKTSNKLVVTVVMDHQGGMKY